MKLLHTADWHIGQLFYDYDRNYEHQAFLKWLLDTLKSENIDVLLICGDIFDSANPSAQSLTLLYSFLSKVVQTLPHLTVIAIAGNHDSGARLESVQPLLSSSNIYLLGYIENSNNTINYDKFIIPLKDKNKNIQAWCLAIPFLRPGNYPTTANIENKYVNGVLEFYKNCTQRCLQLKSDNTCIIATGHLHMMHAEISGLDNCERIIMGGVEGIDPQLFPSEIKYFALGHIHKSQIISNLTHIRYSGSPLPLSFSEENYKHQVIIFDIENQTIQNIRTLQVPVVIPLIRIPNVPKPLSEVLLAIQQLPLKQKENDLSLAPYLEVKVLLDKPEPNLRYYIEKAIENKWVRLAKITISYAYNLNTENKNFEKIETAKTLQPFEIFLREYEKKYNSTVPQELIELFHIAENSVYQNENKKN